MQRVALADHSDANVLHIMRGPPLFYFDAQLFLALRLIAIMDIVMTTDDELHWTPGDKHHLIAHLRPIAGEYGLVGQITGMFLENGDKHPENALKIVGGYSWRDRLEYIDKAIEARESIETNGGNARGWWLSVLMTTKSACAEMVRTKAVAKLNEASSAEKGMSMDRMAEPILENLPDSVGSKIGVQVCVRAV